MEPILKTIAREYSLRYGDLKEVCFLFPNQRCKLFLKKYLAQYNVGREKLPHMLTISEFVSQIAKKKEASRIEQLFTLYRSYCKIKGEKEKKIVDLADFDSFRNWGEIVLSDFNVVALYLENPYEIFKNLKEFKEITSDFLTPHQKEVIKEYFGVEETETPNKFWKQFENPENMTSLKTNFLNLWQVLGPLYKEFSNNLSERSLGFSGSIFREACDIISKKGSDALVYKKIVAVGFNALTEAERGIFNELKQLDGYEGYDDFTDFIWDATGPFLNNKNFSASRFVLSNIKHFPYPDWFLPALKKEKVIDYPEITIIAAPSLTSQTKIVGDILEGYKSMGKTKDMIDSQVAVILPDENLLTNLLYSLPDELGDINLTMGVSLRQTPISAFVAILKRIYKSRREGKQQESYYVKDLKVFFSHPYSFVIFPPEEIENFLNWTSQFHKVSVTLEEVSNIIPSFKLYMSFPSKKREGDKIFDFLRNILEFLIENLSRSSSSSDVQDIETIRVYLEYIESLKETMTIYNIESSALSILQLIDKIVASEKIGFEGEPLSGLQIMGTLESRSLDFKEVIIMSMNEGIMPRKAFVSTFIPETLRRAYGLPPARYSEEIFGYYFYRLLSRAEKVTLLYDARTVSGLRGGESRYLLQLLQYVPKNKIKRENWQFRLQNHKQPEIDIQKTDEIKKLTESFSNVDDTRKNFSASSLNNYRECQIKFFLQNILNINGDPEKEEYMDAISVGDVVHAVMMDLYLPENLQGKLLQSPVVIERSFLTHILNNPTLIKEKTVKNIYKKYYGEGEGSVGNFTSGVTEMMSQQIIELINAIVTYDLGLAPFNLYGCEITKKIRVKLSSGRIVNFNFAIDRLDEIEIRGEKRLRIVDYKTGSRKRYAASLKEVFDGGYRSEQIFQLFVYAWLLAKLGIKGSEDVVTEIYFVPDLIKGVGGLPEIDGVPVESFKVFSEEFGKRLEEMIESIFINPSFRQCREPSGCAMCAFKSFCNK